MEVSAFSISKHLSDLVGRHVAVKVADTAAFTPETRTACYVVEPLRGTAVVQLDYHLLGSLSGTMIGLPNPEIDQQIRTKVFDANMTDAAGELMNVLSAVIVSEGRAIFKGLFPRAVDYSSRAQDLLRGTYFPLKLLVTLAGSKAGHMVIVSDTV